MFKRMISLSIMLSLTLAPIQVQSSPSKKPYGGVLVLGDSNQPSIINPVLVNSGISSSVDSLVFNRLVRPNLKGEIEPELAESWEISENGRIYTFHLRHGVKFHDGVEFTSEDVLFTYQKIKDPQTGCPYRSAFNNIQDFSAPDQYTFKIFLKEPQELFVNELQREIIPKHMFETQDFHKNSFNRKPVGTGPFKFKEWKKDLEIVLEANKDYYEGRPYLDKVIFRNYPNKADVWSAFMRGEVDLVRFINVEDYELTKGDPAFNTSAVLMPDYYLISYNLNDPILSDLRIRQAIAHAVNRKELINQIEKGYGMECTGPFHEGSWAFNPEVQAFSYDPIHAIKILKEAGWQDADSDGILEKDKIPFVIRMMVDSRSDKMRKMAMLIRQQLQEVGIKIEIHLYEDDQDNANFFQSPSLEKPGARLISFFGNEVYPNQAIKIWHSQDQRRHKLWGIQPTNPEVDRLIDLVQMTKDTKIYKNIHRAIYEDQPACFLYFPFMFHASSKNIGNTELILSTTYISDYIIKDLYVKQKGGDA